MDVRLLFMSVLFTILLPGVAVLLIPYLILQCPVSTSAQLATPWAWIVGVGWLVSLAILLSSIWIFAAKGEGTLAPIEPPKHLVVTGLYRYTRNPMYIGVVAALTCEAILFLNIWLGLYALIVFLLFHLFVLFYEEPVLRANFGGEFEDYQAAVPRWGVRIKPYRR